MSKYLVAITKKLLKLFLYMVITFVVISFLVLQNFSLVNHQKSISGQEMKTARASVKKIADKMASDLQFVEFDISQQELLAISKLGSHLLPRTKVNINASALGVTISSSTTAMLPFKFVDTQYINIICWLFEGSDHALQIEKCTIGHMSISGWLVQKVVISSASLFFGEQVANTLKQLITTAKYKNHKVIFSAEKSAFFKEQVNASLKSMVHLTSKYIQSGPVDTQAVKFYIAEINKIQSKQLSDFIRKLFSLAKKRSIDNKATSENRAIIWALAVSFAEHDIGRLIGIKLDNKIEQVPLLRGREDLTKHFIYSALLEQLSGLKIGLNIGEAKELLDSSSGGSGYSFADLAADKAGLKFAHYITMSNEQAKYAQDMLLKTQNESYFFPYIDNLPEGINAKEFEKVFKSTNSLMYKKLEQEVDTRVNRLGLYNKL